MRVLRQRDGFSLVMSVIILVVLLSLGIGLYSTVRSLVRESVFQSRLAQSESIAEAGVEDALYQLRLNSSLRTAFTKNFAGGSYAVSFSTASPPRITSTGYSASLPLVGPAKTQIQLYAQLTGGATIQCPNMAGSNKAFIQGVVDAYNSSVNTNPSTFSAGGNICSNNQVQLQSGSQYMINGDVYYGVAPAPSAAQVTGTVNQSTFTRTVPLHDGSSFAVTNNNSVGITPAAYLTSGQVNVPSGITVTLQPGTYYLNGITVNSGGTLNANSASGAVIIYLNGNLNNNGTFSNSSLLPSRLAIYPQGSSNINLQSSSSNFYGVVEGPNATIFTSQVVYGKLSGGSLNLTANFHYDTQTDSGNNGAVTRAAWNPGSWGANQ